MNLKRTLIFICVGVIFIVVGIVVIMQGNSLKKRCTEETIGTVVELIREVDSDNKSTYFPIIEYKTRDRIISQKSKSGQNPPEYKEGEQVEIYYDPNNVQDYIIKGDSTSNFVGILSIVLGTIVVAVGFIRRNS